METVTRTRPVDGKPIGATVLAGLTVRTSPFWPVSTVIATAGIAAALDGTDHSGGNRTAEIQLPTG